MVDNSKRYAFTPDYVVPPGASLRDAMEQVSMTQASLAKRLGTTVQSLNRIFKGEQPITPDMALKLELVMGTPARFWNSLQAQYEEQLVKREEKARLDKEMDDRREWLEKFPLREMKKRGYIEDSKDMTETYRSLLAFFGMANGAAWPEIWDNAVAARRSARHETDRWHAAVWIRQGERVASGMSCGGYDADKFKAALRTILGLTDERPDSFIPKMIDLCSKAGVALALVPELSKVPWNGATKWLHSNKAMIILSLRGKSEDRFWFSFFHEAAHVLHHSKGQLHYADESDDPVEVEADRWAAEQLISARHNPRILTAQSDRTIRAIAADLGVSSGIVAGRHGHLTRKWQLFRKLIRPMTWKEVAKCLP